MKKFFSVIILIFFFSSSFVFASLSNIWDDEFASNPSKIFFRKNSIFLANIKFQDSFLLSSNPNSVMQQPFMDVNLNFVGGVFAFNIGADVSHTSSSIKYDYSTQMRRYINIAFSSGYKYFSLSIQLSLYDNRQKLSTFTQGIPFISFLRESYFTSYDTQIGESETNIQLSLLLTDTNYFSFAVCLNKFMSFNNINSVFDMNIWRDTLSFSATFKSPKYNYYDDLNPVVCIATLDTINVFSKIKHIVPQVDLFVVLSEDYSLALKNKFDLFIYDNSFSFDDSSFKHTISAYFKSHIVSVELGFSIPASTYKSIERAFQSYIDIKVFL